MVSFHEKRETEKEQRGERKQDPGWVSNQPARSERETGQAEKDGERGEDDSYGEHHRLASDAIVWVVPSWPSAGRVAPLGAFGRTSDPTTAAPSARTMIARDA